VWGAICDVIGKPEWKTDPDYATPNARLPRLKHIFGTIEQWTMTKTKFEAMDILNKLDIPCGPILSMKELARRTIPARNGYGRGSRSSHAWAVSHCGQSDQII
jgi:Predicted acyl-CoA transferases/carnitine dehydratase